MAGPGASDTRLKCNDFEGWITVDKKELKEYGMEKKGREASCWIASETDKEFSVHYRKDADAKYDYAAKVYLDGILVSQFLIKGEYGKQVSTISHTRVSLTEGRKFTFGSLELTDDDAHLTNMSSSAAIGEIKVEIRRVSILSQGTGVKPLVIPEAEKVHERSKKALAHQVKFSKTAMKPSRGKAFNVQHHEFLATMTFRYRPLQMLQANGIVPYEPTPTKETPYLSSPSPLLIPKKRKVDHVKLEISGKDDADEHEDDDDDIIAMTQTLRADLDRLEKKISERKEAGHLKKKVKKEASESAPHFARDEVIDLTL